MSARDVYALSASLIRILDDPHLAASLPRISHVALEGYPNQTTFAEQKYIVHQMIRERERKNSGKSKSIYFAGASAA